MWLTALLQILTQIPSVVAGIEHIHGDAVSGATKKQLALEALGLAGGVVGINLPKQKPIVDAVTTLASQTIDGVVSVMNTAKQTPNVVPAPLLPPLAEDAPVIVYN